MVRDIQDRLDMFNADVRVVKVALTMAQIKRYNPPPNPVKAKDVRAPEYVRKHGASSWEVDALQPEVLAKLIRTNLDQFTDWGKIEAVKAREVRDKDRLRTLAQDIR